MANSAKATNSNSDNGSKRVLAIDIGGTNVKLLATGQKTPRKIPSGPALTARDMVRKVKDAVKDWDYDVISIGYPGPVVQGRPLREPFNLAPGWVKFDYRKAFGKPVKIINDAAMQALGSYKKGRMLFLGLGTGLGSAMIVDGVLQPMELAHLQYKKGRTYEDYLGLRGLEKLGKKKWEKHVGEVVAQLRQAIQAEDVVLGGGNAKKLSKLPPGTRLGSNSNAFTGGFRMWQDATVRHGIVRTAQS
jgi:polyphosphate glucokinase